MAHDHDAVVWIEFLLKARWHIAHRHVQAICNVRRLELPQLPHIQQHYRAAAFTQGLQFRRRDFEIHCPMPSEATYLSNVVAASRQTLQSLHARLPSSAAPRDRSARLAPVPCRSESSPTHKVPSSQAKVQPGLTAIGAPGTPAPASRGLPRVRSPILPPALPCHPRYGLSGPS